MSTISASQIQDKILSVKHEAPGSKSTFKDVVTSLYDMLNKYKKMGTECTRLLKILTEHDDQLSLSNHQIISDANAQLATLEISKNGKLISLIQNLMDVSYITLQQKHKLEKLKDIILSGKLDGSKTYNQAIPLLNNINTTLTNTANASNGNVNSQEMISISIIILQVACASIDLTANASMAMAKSTMLYAQVLQDLAAFQKFLAWMSGKYKELLAQKNKQIIDNTPKDKPQPPAIPVIKLVFHADSSSDGEYQIERVYLDPEEAEALKGTFIIKYLDSDGQNNFVGASSPDRILQHIANEVNSIMPSSDGGDLYSTWQGGALDNIQIDTMTDGLSNTTKSINEKQSSIAGQATSLQNGVDSYVQQASQLISSITQILLKG